MANGGGGPRTCHDGARPVTPVEAKAAYEAQLVLEGCALVCAVGTGLYVRFVRWALGTVGVWLL